MLLTATLTDAPSARNGCLALLSSPSLAKWTLREPFWPSHFGLDHECPDLFRGAVVPPLLYGGPPDDMRRMAAEPDPPSQSA